MGAANKSQTAILLVASVVFVGGALDSPWAASASSSEPSSISTFRQANEVDLQGPSMRRLSNDFIPDNESSNGTLNGTVNESMNESSSDVVNKTVNLTFNASMNDTGNFSEDVNGTANSTVIASMDNPVNFTSNNTMNKTYTDKNIKMNDTNSTQTNFLNTTDNTTQDTASHTSGSENETSETGNDSANESAVKIMNVSEASGMNDTDPNMTANSTPNVTLPWTGSLQEEVPAGKVQIFKSSGTLRTVFAENTDQLSSAFQNDPDAVSSLFQAAIAKTLTVAQSAIVILRVRVIEGAGRRLLSETAENTFTAAVLAKTVAIARRAASMLGIFSAAEGEERRLQTVNGFDVDYTFEVSVEEAIEKSLSADRISVKLEAVAKEALAEEIASSPDELGIRHFLVALETMREFVYLPSTVLEVEMRIKQNLHRAESG